MGIIWGKNTSIQGDRYTGFGFGENISLNRAFGIETGELFLIHGYSDGCNN